MRLIDRRLDWLRGQAAWITGGRRIGRAVSLALAECGVDLILSYRRSQTEAEETARQARGLGVRALCVQADVSSRESVAAAVERVRGEFPRIGILINMASVYRRTDAGNVTEREWEENIGAHILGAFWPVQAIAPLMPAGGHIVNIADVTSIGRPQRRNIPYIATKAAVAAMTRAMALDYGPQGLIVNAIAPGPILPPEDFPRDVWERIRARSPLKPPMTDQEAVEQFALLALYLCTATASTGHVYPLDVGENLI